MNLYFVKLLCQRNRLSDSAKKKKEGLDLSNTRNRRHLVKFRFIWSKNIIELFLEIHILHKINLKSRFIAFGVLVHLICILYFELWESFASHFLKWQLRKWHRDSVLNKLSISLTFSAFK